MKVAQVAILSLVLGFCTSSLAKANSSLSLQVVYGDKKTSFQISKTAKGGQVELLVNGHTQKSKDISSADYEYLQKKIIGISMAKDDKKLCSRNYILATADKRQGLGCLGSVNKASREARDTANLLSLLF